jgi:hypothetical protein
MTGLADNTFSFYDEARQKFLVSTSTSSTHLRNQVYCNVDTSFAITIDGVTATATITNTEGDYKGNLLRYHTGDYFTSNKNTSSTYKDVCVYRLEGAEGEIPTVDANIEVPDSDESIVITEDGVAEPTAIEEVVFNYVGNWNIKVEADKEWLNVDYDAENNCLKYTAEKNADPKRTAVVTITATLGDKTLEPWTFNMLQKGAPMDYTIEAFVALSKDENSSYRLTGKVTTLAENNSTKGYGLSDEKGNTVTINYLKDEKGDAIYGHDDISIELGDVMTVVTVPAGSKKGGISSTYPSIYKGHYRLTATPSATLVSHEGGAVTIALATEGNLQPADAVINVTLVEGSDFVTFDYTAGASTATATFAANNGASRDAEFKFTFGLATVSVVIGQYNHPDVKIGWYLVTDINELAVGDKVIIAAKSPDGSKNYAIKKYTTTNSTSPGVAITLQGSSIKDVKEVEKFTLGSGHADYNGTWSFKCDSYSKYLYQTGSSVKFTSTLDKTSSWAITIAEDGKATLVSQTTNSANTMMFNYTAYNQTFGMYSDDTTGKGAIYIYKEYK